MLGGKKGSAGLLKEGGGRGGGGISGFWLVARCVGDPSPDGGWRRGAGLVGRVWGQSGLLELRSLRTARGRVQHGLGGEGPPLTGWSAV